MKVFIGDYPKSPKDESKREIRIKIDKFDTYSLCDNLALIILPSLKQFRKECCAYPPEFSSLKEWKTVLDKMIYSFQAIVDDNSWNSDRSDQEKIQEGLKLFGVWYSHLWW